VFVLTFIWNEFFQKFFSRIFSLIK